MSEQRQTKLAAEDLFECGLWVFPLKPKMKKPAIDEWKKYQTERPTEEEISKWWRDKPTANIAVITGPASGILVLDVDGDEGREALRELEARNSPLPETWRSRTGNGEHIWFRYPEGREIEGSVGKIGAGLDVRGIGGYVVGPGSWHENGVQYRWLEAPGGLDLADAPAWLLDLLDPPRPAVRSAVKQEPASHENYVQVAIEGECDAVRNAGEGTRNDRLNRAAFFLGQFVGAGKISEQDVKRQLLNAAKGCGLGEIEATKTIESGIAAGRQKPREIPERERTQRAQPAAGNDTTEDGDSVAAENSEIALADEFTRQYGDTWRHVALWGKWFVWNGSVWAEDQRMEVWDHARKVVQAASQSLGDNQKQPAAKALASCKTVSAVIQLSRSHPKHAALADQWDLDPWALNTPGGYVNLKTGTMFRNEPGMHCTKITAVAPADSVPDDCAWLRFLRRVCGDNDQLVQFLQLAAGYSLTGSTKEESFFFLYGLGQNGKSKFVEAMSGVMGSYHESAGMETFTASKFETHPADLAKLRGARLVTATETEEGRRWAESKIKAITGGDAISARFMRQDFFTFKPQLKLWIAGNHKPGLRNVDPAMRRRMNLIPFSVAIPESERDRDLSEKLKAEWPIILRWMIDGCLEWQRVGLCIPDIVKAATADYMAAEDSMQQWIDECCDIGRAYQTTSEAAFQSWKLWADRSGEHAGSQRKFSQRLEDRGFDKTRTRTGRIFFGLAVRESAQNGSV